MTYNDRESRNEKCLTITVHIYVNPILAVRRLIMRRDHAFVLIVALYFGLFLTVSEVGGIPEPITMLLFGLGLIGMLGLGKKFQK